MYKKNIYFNKMIIVLLILILVILIISMPYCEGFDAVGLVLNTQPNWFVKQTYNPSDWVVNQYPDIIQPSCLPYDKAARYGSLENINYLSNAQRFWRF